MNLHLLLQGLGLGAGLIIAIGAQNAFVLRQGLKHERHITIATVCFLVDAVLITMGGLGMGTLVSSTPVLASGAAIVGALFLFVYGAIAFRRAWKGDATQSESSVHDGLSLKNAVVTTLGFSLLNPHVYLDTVVLLGGISGGYPWPDRFWFLGGAVLASALWFYALAFAATKLAVLFKSPRTWQVLDTLIGIVMWSIAWSLVGTL